MNTSLNNAELQKKLQSELKPVEFISWAGQPDPVRYARSARQVWLFFIPWTAFAIFWMVAATGFRFPSFEDPSNLFFLFGLPFVLIGVGGLSSPIWMRRRAKDIIYAVTDQRALSIEGKRNLRVTSYYPKDLGTIERIEQPDGFGSLMLRSSAYLDADGDRRTKMQGFIAIAEVRQVHRLIEELCHQVT